MQSGVPSFPGFLPSIKGIQWIAKTPYLYYFTLPLISDDFLQSLSAQSLLISVLKCFPRWFYNT